MPTPSDFAVCSILFGETFKKIQVSNETMAMIPGIPAVVSADPLTPGWHSWLSRMMELRGRRDSTVVVSNGAFVVSPPLSTAGYECYVLINSAGKCICMFSRVDKQPLRYARMHTVCVCVGGGACLLTAAK